MSLDVYKEWLGIPDGPRPPDHYELLRAVRFEDDAERVRKNYKKLNAHVRKYASGQFAKPSQDLLNELAKAMLCLTDPLRKRDYDETLGRVFEEPPGPLGRTPMERILVERAAISREQMREATSFAEARGLSMRDAVVQMKLVDAETAAQAYAQELNLPYVDLSDVLPDDSILDRVPRDLVKRNTIMPLFIDDDMLLVACVDEPGSELEDELRLRFGRSMRPVIATPLAINQGIAKYYAHGARDESAAAKALSDPPPRKSSGKKGDAKKSEPPPAKSPPRSEAKPKYKPMSQLDETEQRERKQIGYLILIWGVIIPMVADYFLQPHLPGILKVLWWTPVTALFVIPAAAYFVFKVYWK